MSERVDLVGADGTPLAWRVLRSQYEKHRYDRYQDMHMQNVVATVVNPDGEVLVHERAKGKSEEGLIDLICETVKAGESPEDAVTRGIREESGIILDDGDAVVLVGAGLNEYGRFCRRFGVQLGSHKPASVQDSKEVAWEDFLPVDDLARFPNDAFVDGFWPDMHAATTKLQEVRHGAGVI
jgi:ADP-ribose pyrophosphatase YjhB (NUDIX family)